MVTFCRLRLPATPRNFREKLPPPMDFSNKFTAELARINGAIARLAPAPPADAPAGGRRLAEAMRYSLQAGGKRVRPMLALAAFEVCAAGRPGVDPLPCAVALECVHTYSLIHDDLPCMDNDDLRRGRPTLHKRFDEATALLAGDALLTEAFRLMATHYDGDLSRALSRTLADAASGARLIGGQMQDILAERGAPPSAAELEYIHLNKTAALLEASLVCGGLMGGAGEDALALLREAGRRLGLAFQIVDDILDATADTASLGKTAGKDAAAGKTTYASLHGLPSARKIAAEQTAAALDAFRSLPGGGAFPAWLAERLLNRKN
ncbi:MAG: polyprenyl synthetase family protein [Opitutaceae bacterium]|jgi:geranylgeranyl pyrophosphate synthase|nr:polyprenyl synthetase family protein [Opitutaceae bacterium]